MRTRGIAGHHKVEFMSERYVAARRRRRWLWSCGLPDRGWSTQSRLTGPQSSSSGHTGRWCEIFSGSRQATKCPRAALLARLEVSVWTRRAVCDDCSRGPKMAEARCQIEHDVRTARCRSRLVLLAYRGAPPPVLILRCRGATRLSDRDEEGEQSRGLIYNLLSIIHFSGSPRCRAEHILTRPIHADAR